MADNEDRIVDKRPAWMIRVEEIMDRYDIECGLEPRSKVKQENPKEDYFWSSRYAKEKLFAIRKYMRDDELESLVFDLRYSAGKETELDVGSIKRETGPFESASREVRFVKNHEFNRSFDEDPLEIQGKVVRYPNNKTGIECKFVCAFCVQPLRNMVGPFVS